MPRTKRAKKPKERIDPRKGDQPLLVPGTDGAEVASAAAKPAPAKKVASRTQAVDRCFPAAAEVPEDEDLQAKGKVYRWYRVHGARGKIWVSATSPADALGTYRVSRFFRTGDDRPIHRGRTRADLPPGESGLQRRGRTEVQEVIGQQPKKK